MGLFGTTTYPCRHCGKPCLSPREAATHCDHVTHADWSDTGRECPRCNGRCKVYGPLGDERSCPRCGGRGTI